MTIESTASEAAPLSARLRIVTVRALFESMSRSTANKLSQELFWEADEENRPLFRLEPVQRWNRTMKQLTVQWVGTGDPDMSLIQGKELSYSSTVLQIDPGSVWSFEALAHPTTTKAAPRDKDGAPYGRGKRVTFVTEPEQRLWLQKRMPNCDVHIRAFRSGMLEDEEGHDRYRFLEASGTLVAHQPKELEQVLAHGMGAAKHAGLGMLKIRRLGAEQE